MMIFGGFNFMKPNLSIITTAVMFVVLGIAFNIVAIAAEVPSVNIVGYNKLTLPPSNKLILVGINLDAFDPTLKGVLGTNQLIPGTAFSYGDADQVRTFNTGSQKYEFYAIRTNDYLFHNCANLTEWMKPATNPPIVPGMGFWLKSSTTSTLPREITLIGQVVSVVTQSMNVVSGLQFLAYPFSCDINIQNTSFTNGANKGSQFDYSTADQIVVWCATKYQNYGLKSNGLWYACNNLTEWIGTPATTNIVMGQGFWYKKTKGIGYSWVETNKYLAAFQ
jgi:hypothetical protein